MHMGMLGVVLGAAAPQGNQANENVGVSGRQQPSVAGKPSTWECWRVWRAAAVLPLTIVGFALVHAYAARANKGVAWLTLMYVLWIVLDPVKWVWVGCVVVDAFADFRARWASSSGQGSGGA